MQCLPLAWACLAIKEAGKKAKDVRNREASRSYQEVALLDFIKLCHSNLFRLVADALYVVSTSIFGVVCVVWGSRVSLCATDCMGCDPREQVMFLSDPEPVSSLDGSTD